MINTMRKSLLNKLTALLFLVYTICACSIVTGCKEVYTSSGVEYPPIVNGATFSANDLHRKTVALYDVRDGDPFVFCSGVWVGEREILTANHCDSEDDPGMPIRFAVKSDVKPDGEHFSNLRIAFIERRDSSHDLLLLKISPVFIAPEHEIADLSTDPFVGENVQTDGHPMGLWWSYSTGVVSAVRRVDVGDEDISSGMQWIQSTAPVSPGNSGGGLFDSDGNLLGICSRGIFRGQNLNLYVHTQHIRNFLTSK